MRCVSTRSVTLERSGEDAGCRIKAMNAAVWVEHVCKQAQRGTSLRMDGRTAGARQHRRQLSVASSLALASGTHGPSKIALRFLRVNVVTETQWRDSRRREPSTRGRGTGFPAALARRDEPREGSAGTEEHLVGVSPVPALTGTFGQLGCSWAKRTVPLKLGCELGVLPRGHPSPHSLQVHGSGTSGPTAHGALLDGRGICWEGAPCPARHGSRAVGVGDAAAGWGVRAGRGRPRRRCGDPALAAGCSSSKGVKTTCPHFRCWPVHRLRGWSTKPRVQCPRLSTASPLHR